jgi:hypothetical protein
MPVVRPITMICNIIDGESSLITKRSLTVRHLLMVKHESTGVIHYIAVLPDGHYVCDCCMPSNLGVPCRHYFRIWIDVQNMPFHISLIRPRCVVLYQWLNVD